LQITSPLEELSKMAQTGYTPIQLYYSTTASAAPTAANLLPGELGLNITDGKLYYEDNVGSVQLLASKAGAAGSVTSVAMTVPAFLSVSGSPITSSGTLAVSYSGTALPVANGGTGTTTPNLVAGSNVTITGTWPNQTINATGTVTSVALSGGTTGITVSGSPITSSGTMTLAGTLAVANGGTGLTSGTSGGVPYFSGTTTVASSAALTQNQVVLGGGAGAAPATTSLAALSAAVTTGNYFKVTSYADEVSNLGNTGTAINIDLINGGVFTATLTGNCTFTLRYPVASGASSFTLILTNDATPSRTVAWAGGSFKFPGGAASLSRSTAAGAVDIWVFFTPDAGTTWYGNIAMANMAA
jgi:hypothetical protein